MTEAERPCKCVICQPGRDLDDIDRAAVADVQRHGWHVLKILADEHTAGWAFTIGLWHTYRHPEIAIFGLRLDDMHTWLNRVGDTVRAGTALSPAESVDGVLDAYAFEVREVDRSWHRALFGTAMAFYQAPRLPVHQLVWPDRAGRYPWDADCGERCRRDQPWLWVPVANQSPGPWTALA